MIVTKTTELGIQSILYIAQQRQGHRVNPQEIASRTGESQTYIAKVLRLMSSAGILRSHRGVSGGYEMARRPEEITLLDVVEACQGAVQGNYCQEVSEELVPMMCGYHQAMFDLKKSCRDALSRWSVARILEQPVARVPSPGCRFRRIRIRFERATA